MGGFNLKVKISETLYRTINKEYISISYIIGEILPMIEKTKSSMLTPFDVKDEKVKEILIDDILMKEIRTYFGNIWTDSQIINYILGLGYIMGV